ncbi:hypothetical protein [Candidatus Pyrohabitans sp.]
MPGDLTEIKLDIREIKTDLKYIRETLDKYDQTFEGHEKRIRAIEDWKNRTTGIFSVVGGIGGTVGAAIVLLAEWLLRRW